MSWVRGPNGMMLCPKHPGQEWKVGAARTCQKCIPGLDDDPDGEDSEASRAVAAAEAAGIRDSLALEREIRGIASANEEYAQDESVPPTARVAAWKTAGALLCFLHGAARARERENRLDRLKRQGERRFGRPPREIGTEHADPDEVH